MTNETTNETKSTLKVKKILTDWILPILIAVIVAYLIRKFLIFQIHVPSGSMLPTLQEQEKFMTERIYHPEKLKRGDIVVFDSKELDETMVKRLIGLPNDHIEIKDGVVSVNGEVLVEDYVKYPSDSKTNKKTDGVYDVPEGKYFFLGDNRNNSLDSRYWKNHFIDESDIQGKVLFRTFPLKKFGSVK